MDTKQRKDSARHSDRRPHITFEYRCRRPYEAYRNSVYVQFATTYSNTHLLAEGNEVACHPVRDALALTYRARS